ncbi:HAMP domain-containing protein [Roseateles sp. GG27B]
MASYFIIRSSIARNADASIAAELKTGNRVLHRLLAQEAYKLRDASELLAKDYGFRRAVGLTLAENGSVETIRDALANQGERIGASVVAYFNNDLQLVAATTDGAGRFVELLKQNQAAGDLRQKDLRDMQLTLLDGRAYQVAFVQVKTPAPVGWILMGFELDNNTLLDLQQLSDLRAIIVSQDSQGAWSPLISNVEASAARSLLAQLPAAGGMFPAMVADEEMRGLFVPLLQQGQPHQQQPLGLVLLRSFDEAVAPYRALQLTLLALTLLGVGVFVLGAILMARRISGPITGLAKVAARLGRGDYDRPVRRKSADEIGDLAAAFRGRCDKGFARATRI